uniref:KAT8 regulatory NSL complex subunit 1-like protein isoform X2 n=1 Tax=Geotrypetes seraphini TaxID=260995 RepID=A0A6P8QSD6_GEOSA|nr:KAT8 regulatory NSL complex subunit 1-like protein isoform X2 [Geotrypetes seraphini]
MVSIMTPALTEASTEGHGIHLSPLSSRTMSSETAMCMESSRAGEQSTCPKLCNPKIENGLCTDIRNLKHFGTAVAPTSTQYQTVVLLSSNSVLNLQNKNNQQRKSEERDTCKLRHSSQHFAGNSSEPETQVKRELFPGCARQLLTDAHGVCDMTEIECSGADKIQVKCKWHKRNGCLDKSIVVPTEPKFADFHSSKLVLQGYADVPKNSSNYGKEEEMNTRLQRCLNKQQILLSQAKRAQKRLHSLIAKHVVEHCSHQVRCFVKHQLQRMKIFHKPDRSFDSNIYKSTEIQSEAGIANCETNPCRESKNGFSIPAPHEVHSFGLSAAGLLSHVESALDSDATGSSSDEDLDDKGMQKNEAGDYSSEWTWLVDRARVGSRWTWLQAQISELEYKIQQLTDIHNQIRATKGMVILEEFALPKERGKQQPQSTVLKSTGGFPAPLQGQDSSLTQDLEMSPSSPTLLLRNIEKQSAQLSEIVNSLITPLSLSPTSSPRSSKSFSHKRLANGICLSALKNRDENSSTWHWNSDQQHTKKRRKDRMRMKSPAVSSACTSARTRPLQSIHKRKLYRLNSACCLNQLPLSSEAILLQCGRQLPFTMPSSTCSSCERSKTRALGQHILEVDSSFHPVLSLPSDVSLHVYLNTSLNNLDDVKSFSIENTPVKEEYAMTPTNEAQCSMSCSQCHSGYSPNSQHHPESEMLKELSEGRKRRHKSETAEESDTKYETSFTCQNISGSQNNSSAVPDAPVVSRLSQKPSAQGTMRRRLRSESSYDIDNIVIPMSLVAPSKVEKLQYKEILTPSWRVVDIQPLRLHVEEEEVEDLSDEAFSSRHECYEEKEKARWSLWEQSRWHRRNSRSSRITDEWQGYASTLRGNSSDCWPLVHSASEGVSDVMSSETYCFDSIWSPNSPEEKQERKLSPWEQRIFPLVDEAAAALQYQDSTPLPETARSSSSSYGDSLSNSRTSGSIPNSNSPPKIKPSEKEQTAYQHISPTALGRTTKKCRELWIQRFVVPAEVHEP